MNNLMFFSSKLHRGGAEMHLVRLANALTELDKQVYIIPTQGSGPFEKLLSSKVSLFKGFTKVKSYTLALTLSIPKLIWAIRRYQPDALISIQDGPNVAMLWAAWLARFQGVKIIWVQNNPKTLQQSVVGRSLFQIARRWYPYADLFIALSKGVGRQYVLEIPELLPKLKVVHNIGFPDEANQYVSESVKQNTLRLLAVGRLERQKDYPTMFKALAILQERLKISFHLTILGDGSLKDDLLSLAQKLGITEKITFQGFVQNPWAHFRNSDMLLLTSRWEGFGNVIVEAMAFGTVVIATDCPHGPGEIIHHGVNGFLTPIGDAFSLAKNIEYLYDHPEVYHQVKANALVRAAEFKAQTISKEFIQILDARIIHP